MDQTLVSPNVLKKVATAKVSLLTRPEFIFYSSILVNLKLLYTDKLKTAGVDGVHLFMNPDFVDTLDNKQLVFLLLHETMHMVYQHITRKGNRDHKLWNVAGDYVINNDLDRIGIPVLAGALLDHKYDGMTTDAVYHHLMQEKNQGSPMPEPDFEDIMPPSVQQNVAGSTGVSTPSSQIIEETINDIITSAVVQANQGGAQSAGNIPGEVSRHYENLTQPQVPWQTVLMRYMFGINKSGSSYKVPSRRGAALGLTLPGRRGKSMARIDFAIDTSGSVSMDTFNQFISEIHFIFKKFNPQAIGIMQFDHNLKSRDVINNISDFKDIKFVGGGGTEIRPVLKEFATNEAKALVVLTDGYFHSDSSLDPRKPVIWAIYDNPSWQPPFGQAVHFTL